MPEQVGFLTSPIEQLDEPAAEKQVTVVASFLKQDDGKVLSLYKYIAGQLHEAECPHLSTATAAVRTIHLRNDKLHDDITQYCERDFLSTLSHSVAKKWKDESLLFIATCEHPQKTESGAFIIRPISPNLHSVDNGPSFYCCAHPNDPDFNFDIQEPASPTNTKINLGKRSKGTSFKDAPGSESSATEGERGHTVRPCFYLNAAP